MNCAAKGCALPGKERFVTTAVASLDGGRPEQHPIVLCDGCWALLTLPEGTLPAVAMFREPQPRD